MRPTRNTDRRPAHFPEPGTFFDGRYQLESIIGSGGGSMVFRAVDTRLNRPVAIKILAPGEMDEEGQERFKREALSIARLSHSGIVTIYDFSEVDGQPYLALELVEGQDLWSLLYEHENPLSLETSLTITLNILDALEYAHRYGVVHRDLKPENVMVLPENHTIKVMDFGLAYIRGQRRITADDVVAGSAYYIAPEVAEHRAADHRVDLYALGVMLYEMAAGQLPFYSDSPLVVIAQHLHDAPRPPSQLNPAISPALEAVIMKLLAKHPDDRFQSAGAVKRALRHLDQNQGQRSRPSHTDILNQISRAIPVGREAERNRLRAIWQQIQVGTVNIHPVVLITGEAGSGKTLFVQQLLLEARQSGAVALTGQCYMGDSVLPYRPFTEILRDYLRDHHEHLHPLMAADLSKLVPEIPAPTPENLVPIITPEAEQLRLFEHVTQFFVDIARETPLVLLIEDLHFADPSSIALLEYLSRRIAGHHVLLIGTYRPDDIDQQHPLDVLLRSVNSRDLAERIHLRRLAQEDVQGLLESIFGSQLDSSLADILYEKTEGNLFFIKELLKALVTDGYVTFDDETRHWRSCQPGDLELPDSIRSIIGQQIGKLSEPTSEALHTAAVIGREFSFDLLRDVAEVDEDHLIDILNEAQEIHLINEKQDRREEIYIFDNAAIRQTLLSNLHQRHRARLHLKIAKVLEASYPQPSDSNMLETIARHYSLGARSDQDMNTAIEYLMQAADRASQIFALPGALDLYNQALELVQDDTSIKRESRMLNLRERRGMVSQQLGDFTAAAADLEWVLRSADVEHDLAHKRQVLLQLGQVYRRGEQFSEAIRTLNAAVEISRQIGDERLVADALYYLGATYWSWRKITQAVQHQEEGYRIVTRLGLQDEVAMKVLHGLAEAYMRQGRFELTYKFGNESLQLTRQLGDLEYQAENLSILATIEQEQADYSRSQALWEQAIEVSERARFRLHHLYAVIAYGWTKAVSGDYEFGLKRLREMLDRARDLKGTTTTMLWDYKGFCYLELEAVQRAAECFAESRDCAQRHQISWSEGFSAAHWAIAQIKSGNLAVGSLLEETLESCQMRGDLIHVPYLYQALAMLELQRNNPEKASAFAEELYRIAAGMQQNEQIAQAYRWQGLALLARARYAEALAKLEQGIEIAAMIRRPRLMLDFHRALADVYTALNDAAAAARHRERMETIVMEITSRLSDPILQEQLGEKLL